MTVPEDFRGRILNIHPSLIPAFCGKGFHGTHVHQAALDAGVKVSGCTVHFVDDEYDHGPIVAQRAVPVLEDDTPEHSGRTGVRAGMRSLSRGDPPVRGGPAAHRGAAGADTA